MNLFLTLLAIVVLIPSFILLFQVVMAFFYRSTPTQESTPQLAVLIPAHNEALVIANTLSAIMPQLSTQDHVLVVADNCTDETAAIAQRLGANVVTRQHATERGKGYALDFGVTQLKQNPPQVVVIVDADCIVAPGALKMLARACLQYQRPIQGLYLMQHALAPNLKGRISQFAWVLKNHVRPLGMRTLGLPCQLMGSGMAFLWHDISASALASGHIVEDMKLGTDLACDGKAPLFLPEALVTSTFPTSDTATASQRTRWEHGHLSVILSEAPNLLWYALSRLNLTAFAMACDLIVPPIASLVLACGTLLVLTYWLEMTLAFQLTAIAFCFIFVAIVLAWLGFGRHIISFAQLCYAPFYAITKLPLYLKFFINRQVEWVRSKRD